MVMWFGHGRCGAALDAVGLGFGTELVADGARPVELEPGDGQRAIDEMTAAGVALV